MNKPRKIFECIHPKPASEDYLNNNGMRKSFLNLDLQERNSPTSHPPKNFSCTSSDQSLCSTSTCNKLITKAQLNSLLNYWRAKSEKFAKEKEMLEKRIRAKSLTRLKKSDLTEDKSSVQSSFPIDCENFKVEEAKSSDKKSEENSEVKDDKVKDDKVKDEKVKDFSKLISDKEAKKEIISSLLEKSMEDYSSNSAKEVSKPIEISLRTKKLLHVKNKKKSKVMSYVLITLVVFTVSIGCYCPLFPCGNDQNRKLDITSNLTLFK